MKGGAKDLRLTQALSSSCGPLNSTLWFCHVVNFEFTGWIKLHKTRPKHVDHGYVFSMAVGTIGEWLKLVPFFVRGRTVDSVNTLK